MSMRANHSAASLSALFLSVVGPIPLLAAASCGSDPAPENRAPEPTIDHSVMTENACASDARRLEGVRAGNPVDYLALRRNNGTRDPEVFTSEGTACANAGDQATCMQTLASIRETTGFPERFCGPCSSVNTYLVYTRRDEVGSVTSLDALATFLRPVRDAKTAAFLVRQHGYDLACSEQARNARASGDGFDILAGTGDGCGSGQDIKEHILHVSKDGQVTLQQTVLVKAADPNCASGRRPEGFVLTGPSDDASPLGRFFAEAAELEAASVPAFLRLAEELAHHGAPAALVQRAREAARDEIRHTAMMTSLARRFGAEPSVPEVPHRPVRGLFEIALENAIEGCVHETYAALQATHQARHASDPHIRKIMRRIAKDETQHSALAWNVAAWVEPLLSDEECAHIDRVRCEVAAFLLKGVAEPHPDVVRIAGAPSQAEASRLLDAVAGELWPGSHRAQMA
ncbi:ferritin-like domain-containing protein [Pendulispora brunnea]|uniref:Ferritin-like domain-containing protein n=1 Tax=Pendulispora brunnea TaxID=2905690 RepID=A0ABZ2KIM7_9BACT